MEKLDVFDNPVRIVEESSTQWYMRGSVTAEHKEGSTNQNLVAKDTTYVATKRTNVVLETTNYYLCVQEKKKPLRHYGEGKGGGYCGSCST